MTLPTFSGYKVQSLAKRPNLRVLLCTVTAAVMNMMAIMLRGQCLVKYVNRLLNIVSANAMT